MLSWDFNKPSIAGAVLHTGLQLIYWLIHVKQHRSIIIWNNNSRWFKWSYSPCQKGFNYGEMKKSREYIKSNWRDSISVRAPTACGLASTACRVHKVGASLHTCWANPHSVKASLHTVWASPHAFGIKKIKCILNFC